jgi:hypothetical protein
MKTHHRETIDNRYIFLQKNNIKSKSYKSYIII